ncbi:MAG: hypothetical protein ACREBB_09880 [Nitrosotalea sp.]
MTTQLLNKLGYIQHPNSEIILTRSIRKSLDSFENISHQEMPVSVSFIYDILKGNALTKYELFEKLMTCELACNSGLSGHILFLYKNKKTFEDIVNGSFSARIISPSDKTENHTDVGQDSVWYVRDNPSHEHVGLEEELEKNLSDVNLLCAYDMSKLSEKQLESMITAHRHVIIQGLFAIYERRGDESYFLPNTDKMSSNDPKRAWVCFAIEQSLLEVRDGVLDQVTTTLSNDYDCSILDCYDRPEYLSKTLKKISDKCYVTTAELIKKNLEEFSQCKPIELFLNHIVN